MKRHGGVSRFREAAPPAAFPGIARQRRKAGLHPFMFAITAHSRLGGRNAVEDGAAVAKPIGAGRYPFWKGRGAASLRTVRPAGMLNPVTACRRAILRLAAHGGG